MNSETAGPLHSSRGWTDGVRREVLPNGLTLLVQPDHSAPAVAVVTHMKAGFFDEPDRWTGISHVLEHMFFKGTARRGVGAIARETKSAGGYLNASTTYDHTTYFTVLPAAGLAAAIDIQSDALRNSVVDSGELARELQVIIQEAKRKLDTPSAVAYETLHEVMFDRHRIRRWRIGHEDQLAAPDPRRPLGLLPLALRAGAHHRRHRRRDRPRPRARPGPPGLRRLGRGAGRGRSLARGAPAAGGARPHAARRREPGRAGPRLAGGAAAPSRRHDPGSRSRGARAQGGGAGSIARSGSRGP